jgi:hypothetical protein
MFGPFEAFWTFLIPLSPRPALNAGCRSPLLTATVRRPCSGNLRPRGHRHDDHPFCPRKRSWFEACWAGGIPPNPIGSVRPGYLHTRAKQGISLVVKSLARLA